MYSRWSTGHMMTKPFVRDQGCLGKREMMKVGNDSVERGDHT